MPRALLIDDDANHSAQLGSLLSSRGLTVVRAISVENAVRVLRHDTCGFDLVILIMCDCERAWIKILHDLQQAVAQATLVTAPPFLCVSRVSRGLEFEIRVERMGGRYVAEA
jgi:ActR/RegA family two-component response regulator